MTPLDPTTVGQVLTWAERVNPKLLRVSAIRERFVALDVELRELRNARAPRAEHTESLLAGVRAARAEFVRRPAPGHTTPAWQTVVAPFGAPTPPAVLTMRPEDLVPFLCWALGPLLEAGIPNAMRALPEEPGTRSRAARATGIAAAESERAVLVAEHEALVEEILRESGRQVAVEHLPETRDRLAAEEYRKRQASAVEAGRLEREEAVNARHAAGPRTAPSPYLERVQAYREGRTDSL